MTVKEKRGRRRYLVFELPQEVTRETLIHRLPGGRRFNVIQCAEGMAIVRCAPLEIEECQAAVSEAEPQSSLITISGTLKTLRDRYPVLKRNAPPKPPRVRPPAV